jgi:hypothetical protein
MIVHRSFTIKHGDTEYITFAMDTAEDRLFSMKDSGIDMDTVTVTTQKGDVIEEVCSATVYMAWDF